MLTTVVLARFPDLLSAGLLSVLGGEERLAIVRTDVPLAGMPATLTELEPDLAILDLAQLRSPIEVHELHEAQPETQLVLLAQSASSAECNQLLAFGATAVLPRDVTREDLLTSLSLAARGMHVMPGSGTPAPAQGPDLLTPREADVLELLQQGKSNAEIALELVVGVETVRTHARAIYRKLGVSSRRDLAAAPIVRGI